MPLPPPHVLELRVPPLVLLVAAAALMRLLAQALPWPALAPPAALAAALAAAGAAIAAAGVAAFAQARTSVDPRRPAASAALVRAGPYRFTRNPMYLGMALALAGWAVWLASAAAALVVAAFVAYLDRFQVVPEERVLEVRFGAAFAAYRRAVRRWL